MNIYHVILIILTQIKFAILGYASVQLPREKLIDFGPILCYT